MHKLNCIKVNKGRDTLGDNSLRHVAGPCRRNNSPRVTRLIFMKIMVVAAAEFYRLDLSHEFKPVWIRATSCNDEISESSDVAPCVHFGNKSLRQCINDPMRERHMVSHIELAHQLTFPSYKITAFAPNRLRVAATCFARSTHGATSRRDLSLRLVA